MLTRIPKFLMLPIKSILFPQRQETWAAPYFCQSHDPNQSTLVSWSKMDENLSEYLILIYEWVDAILHVRLCTLYTTLPPRPSLSTKVVLFPDGRILQPQPKNISTSTANSCGSLTNSYLSESLSLKSMR